jgi:hypothetical protein
LDRDAGPQCEGQLQLVRAFIAHIFLKYFLLLWTQGAAASKWAASLLNFKGFFTSAIVESPPCPAGSTADTSNCTDLVMFPTLLSKSNDLVAKLLLCISAEFSQIYFFHARHKSKSH